MLLFIAELFGTGIGLGLFFLAVYFMLYAFRGCLRRKGESAHREEVATQATQIASIFPGIYILLFDAFGITSRIYALGITPMRQSVEDPDEESVFYCFTLLVFWACLSTAVFLFLISGFKVA